MDDVLVDDQDDRAGQSLAPLRINRREAYARIAQRITQSPGKKWEATSGFEPLRAAFAEPCLTTWLRRLDSTQKRAGDGDRTRDFLLGKEMLYH